MTAPEQQQQARGGGATVVVRCPRCESPTVAGTRYEADGTVDVRLCLECGVQEPPFGACCDRPLVNVEVACPICQGVFRVESAHPHQVYCEKVCRRTAERRRRRERAA